MLALTSGSITSWSRNTSASVFWLKPVSLFHEISQYSAQTCDGATGRWRSARTPRLCRFDHRPVTLRSSTPTYPESINIRHASTYANNDKSTEPPVSHQVRNLMRSVPHPVAIITSTSIYTASSSTIATSGSSRAPTLDLFKGATVSSFNTVTLTPDPVVSFNITRKSSTFAAIQLSGVFMVHLMASAAVLDDDGDTGKEVGERQAEIIATKFAMGNEGKPFHDEDGKLGEWVDLAAQAGNASKKGAASGVSSTRKVSMPPVIKSETSSGEQIVSFRLLCEHMKEKTVSIGDHVAVFGKVIEAVDCVEIKKDEFGKEKEERRSALAYVHGRYARVE